MAWINYILDFLFQALVRIDSQPSSSNIGNIVTQTVRWGHKAFNHKLHIIQHIGEKELGHHRTYMGMAWEKEWHQHVPTCTCQNVYFMCDIIRCVIRDYSMDLYGPVNCCLTIYYTWIPGCGIFSSLYLKRLFTNAHARYHPSWVEQLLSKTHRCQAVQAS